MGRWQGMNIIDARWIDTSNGMFVDITGLGERDPEKMPGILSCKNFHSYRVSDLYPMRETEYEGVVALVPYNFDRVLTEEYGTKSLVTTDWQGYVSDDGLLGNGREMNRELTRHDDRHKWNPEKKEWIKNRK